MVGNRKTVLPWHAYGDGSEKLTCLPKHFVKKTISAAKHAYQLRGVASTSLHMRTTISSRQWQPKTAVRRISTYQHGIAPGERSHLRPSTPPFTAEASAKSTPLSASSDAMLMSPNKDETSVHGCHYQGDMLVRMCKVLAIKK